MSIRARPQKNLQCVDVITHDVGFGGRPRHGRRAPRGARRGPEGRPYRLSAFSRDSSTRFRDSYARAGQSPVGRVYVFGFGAGVERVDVDAGVFGVPTDRQARQRPVRNRYRCEAWASDLR